MLKYLVIQSGAWLRVGSLSLMLFGKRQGRWWTIGCTAGVSNLRVKPLLKQARYFFGMGCVLGDRDRLKCFWRHEEM